MNNSLLGVDDFVKIKEIQERNSRPNNVEALRVPELNKEIHIQDLQIVAKDN